MVFLGALAAMLGAVLSVQAAETSGPRRPNILWLAGENIKLDLGCYGEKLVRTPNLDRLAAEGLRFTRVFCTNPACAPAARHSSRACIRRASTAKTRARTATTPSGSRPAFARSPTGLRDAGYFTANIKTIGDRNVGTGKLDLNFVNEGPIYESDDWETL